MTRPVSGRRQTRGNRPGVRSSGRRADQSSDRSGLLLIERAHFVEPIVVEIDRPLAFRPRVVGFWRGTEFHLVTRMMGIRREHDTTYYRVVTDRGAFDLRSIRRMDPLTLRIRRSWELCAELEIVPVARWS
jgi:hypothetical protein